MRENSKQLLSRYREDAMTETHVGPFLVGVSRFPLSLPAGLDSSFDGAAVMCMLMNHVKMVHCGRHEVPNRGHHRDRFCHPETTWKNVRRLRPDCVCAPGYLRNSWGDCISYAECHHCMNKHHMNMDYNLCESQCPPRMQPAYRHELPRYVL
ncbi:hypothetical protein MRX96_025622 [Rhipicephalus microplus]